MFANGWGNIGVGVGSGTEHLLVKVVAERRKQRISELHGVTLGTRPLTCSYALLLEGAFSHSLNLKLNLMVSESDKRPYSFLPTLQLNDQAVLSIT